MKWTAVKLAGLCILALSTSTLQGQTLARTPNVPSDNEKLDALLKKIDEQNVKIDMLSQQILKLEQQISNSRPGVMIGEKTPSSGASPSEAPKPQNGNSHVVARGETLTSIAKMHNVTVSELQKYNHIENDRKLQIGQTIMIPGGTSPAPSASSAQPE